MNILITGGAGYIGSHVLKQLLENTKHNVIVIDNFSTGNKKNLHTLKKIREFKFIELDLKDFNKVDQVIKSNTIDTIMHFAAFSQVEESIKNPIKYYMNNTINTANLIKSASKNSIKKFIFSSTAAVYGEPMLKNDDVITEDYETNPINPYGQSKLMSEKIIIDEAKANKNIKYCIFRYFNVAGADINYENGILKPRIGEHHNPETHLIPIIAKVALNKKKFVTIYGEDYPTFDGTCVRDYIHVDDLASAHIKAINYLEKNSSDIFNVGYGKGYSVKEVIKNIKKYSPKNFIVKSAKKRDGDPAILISDNKKIKAKMNWLPNYEGLELICRSALEWEKTYDS